MAMTEGTVSFHAVSTTRTAAWFGEQLGMRSTRSAEIGELVGNGRYGRRHEFAIWTLERDFDNDSAEPLNDALLALLSEFDGREDVLDGLREDHDLRVQCHGSSASSQGGFWPAPEVLQRLGRLGVDFTCTVYLADCPDVC